MPIHLRRRGRLHSGGLALSIIATLAMLTAILGTIYPIQPKPYCYLPWIYLLYLAAGMLWYAISQRRTA